MSIVKDLIAISVFMLTIFLITSDIVTAGLCTLLMFLLNTFKNLSPVSANLEQEILSQKEFFTETLRHDLKIPTLAQLRGLELIKNETLGTINNEQLELVGQIEASCHYILDMISMILKTYCFEDGRKALPDEYFEVSELLNECVKEINSTAEQKNIKFTFDDNCAERFIRADRKDIKIVISNLLSNAILYSNNNENISVNIIEKNKNLIFEVTSIGEKLTHLECTKMFEKLSSKSPRYSTIGYGISLYLCKKIIESYNGKICAIKNGRLINKFIFSLPITVNKDFAGCFG